MAQLRAHVYVTGIVQGVFFRAHTARRAKALNVKGWVRNLHDGRVEAVFEGESTAVEQMIAWCHEGPPGAVVESVESRRGEPSGEYSEFYIRY